MKAKMQQHQQQQMQWISKDDSSINTTEDKNDLHVTKYFFNNTVK